MKTLRQCGLDISIYSISKEVKSLVKPDMLAEKTSLNVFFDPRRYVCPRLASGDNENIERTMG